MMEVVFDNDWYFTKTSIGSIDPEGTFLNPNLEDEENNWANRGALLSAYRELKVAVERETGIPITVFDGEDE